MEKWNVWFVGKDLVQGGKNELSNKGDNMNECLALGFIVLISLCAPVFLMAILFRGFSGNSGKGGGVDD